MSSSGLGIPRRLDELMELVGNRFWVESFQDVDPSDDVTVTAEASETNAVLVMNFAIPDETLVYIEHDPDGDGSWPVSVEAHQFTESGISQDNVVPISNDANVRLRLLNNGSTSGDYILTGVEIDFD